MIHYFHNQKVSILINNFNYAKYLRYCVESVLNQTYSNFEVIIYDDGSTDNSLEVLDVYSDQVQIISKKNHGKGGACNQANAIYQAFLKSSGEIICLLDSDDAFLPEKLEEIVCSFENDPALVLVQNRMYEITEQNQRTTHVVKNTLYNIDFLKTIFFLQSLSNLFVPTSGLSFRRSFLQKVLPLQNKEFPLLWADVQLTRKALFYGKVMTIRKPLGEYRVHSQNDSKKLKNKKYQKQFHIQHYNYFNQLAAQHGLPTIPHSNNKILYMVKIVLLNTSLNVKFNFLKNKFFNGKS